MKTSYKYLLGAVAVIGAVMLYKKYNKNEVVAPSKAKVASTETAPVASDENSEFWGRKATKNIVSKYNPNSWNKTKDGDWFWADSNGKRVY